MGGGGVVVRSGGEWCGGFEFVFIHTIVKSEK